MQFLTSKFSIVIITIILTFTSSIYANRRYGKPRGFGRQSGFGDEQNQLDQTPGSSPLEYGGLHQPGAFGSGEDVEGIQQVSRDEDLEEFSNKGSKYTDQTTESPEAVTPKGTFVGLRETINGTRVYAFYGVPYAKPPTGNLRFKRPVPTEPLSEPFSATRLPNACPQVVADVFNDFPGERVWFPNTNMSEDCLYLNIWVPETAFNRKENELVPVMFWIFGGGFFSGSNSLDVYNGAELAATQGIVVVNVQYRLGPLGFLYLEPGQGNFGLIDQALGLQWTNQNIEYFGGDPSLVTVAGESCGAASVGLHLVSPKTKGYIKRGVLSSGLPNAKYALKSVEEVQANSFAFAKFAGCEQKSTPEILECLRKIDGEKMAKLQWKLYKNLLEFPFSPIVDGYFLPEHPDILISKGKAKRADLLMGTVHDEGPYFILYHYLNYFSHLKPTSVPYDRFVDIMNELFYDYSETEREAIIDQYTNWENPEDGYVNQQKIGEAVGDAMFVCPHRKFADIWSNRGLGVYYYHFTERLEFNPWAKWMGVMHGDDIPLIFGVSRSEASAPENEKLMIKNFMQMLGNFVREGVPSQKWERYTSEHPVYLDVNATTVSSASTPNAHGPNAQMCAFWNKLLPLLREGNSECRNNAFTHPGPMCQFNNLNAPHHHQFAAPPQMPCHHPPMHFSSPPHYQNPQHYQRDECAAPNNQPAPSTSTSCKCTVQEGSSTQNTVENEESTTEHGYLTPPPAIF